MYFVSWKFAFKVKRVIHFDYILFFIFQVITIIKNRSKFVKQKNKRIDFKSWIVSGRWLYLSVVIKQRREEDSRSLNFVLFSVTCFDTTVFKAEIKQSTLLLIKLINLKICTMSQYFCFLMCRIRIYFVFMINDCRIHY